MSLRQLSLVIFLPTLVVITGCQQEASTERDLRVAPPKGSGAAASSLWTLASPSGQGSGEPHLAATPDGKLMMSWLEGSRETGDFSLRFAVHDGKEWSAPSTIARGNNFFVNWADFPAVAASADGTLFAHWLQKNGESTYAYDVRLAISKDGGTSWSESILLNRDGTKTEHGFVSLAADGDRMSALWLDGRMMKEGEHEGHDSGSMTLRYASIDRDGTISDEAQLDDRTCECCQTSMAMTSNGPIAIYRDRSTDEKRDIGIVRREGSRWTAPALVHADGWKIDGCPVNGPQVDARGNDVVAAWYTGSTSPGHLNVAFSADGGKTFGKPIVADGGKPVGRVDVVLLPDRTAQVTWVEQTGAAAEVRTRRVMPDGKLGDAKKVADSSASRAAGFPRTTLAGGRMYFAWTVLGDPPRIEITSMEYQTGSL